MSERPFKVLVVDKDAGQRRATAQALAAAGYQASESEPGSTTLAQLAAALPDLIVFNVDAVDRGSQFLGELRRDPATARLPVIQVSPRHTHQAAPVAALGGSATAYLFQPLDCDELVSVAASLLRMKEAEERARRASLQWQKTFDSIQDAVALLDGEGCILQANRAMGVLLGKRPSQLRGLRIQESLIEVLGEFDVSAIPPVRASRRQSAEFFVNGRWFLTTVDPVLDESGAVEGSVKVITEITEQKRSEAALARAQDALRMSEKLAATGRLAASIAHEINNPMASVTNLLYLLENRPGLDQQSVEYLGLARQEVSRMTHIIKQMLGFYRESPLPVAVDLREVVESVLALYSHKIQNSRIAVQTRLDSDCTVWGYPGEMRQIVSNLLINAIEAVGDGGRIKIRLIESSAWIGGKQERGARLLLADSGPGIQRQHLMQLFEPFFTTKGEKGTGLGLWVTNGIVRKHGGSIRVRSSVKPGRSGTCFAIFLPARRPAAVTGREENTPSKLSA